jgi:hypothetical protein
MKQQSLPSGEEVVNKVGKNVNDITDEVGKEMKGMKSLKKQILD